MTDIGFQGKQFQVAADRKLGRPLTIGVNHWVQDWSDPADEGGWVNVSFRIDPNTDMIRLGLAVGALGKGMQAAGVDEDVEAQIAQLDRALPTVRRAMRECVVPPDRDAFDVIAPTLGVRKLSEMIQTVMGALSGMDPTERASSLDGSAQDGSPSTAGALPEA
jgi:hypothetical protein